MGRLGSSRGTAVFFFFFQAEDGIRDDLVTGVQTCALPICPDFFNVAEFPTMTYSSTAVKFKGDDPDAVKRNLPLLGVTKPVALRIERWKCGPDPRFAGKRFLCAGNASGSFKRSEFGMKTFLPTGIGDEVKVWMSVYAWRQ